MSLMQNQNFANKAPRFMAMLHEPSNNVQAVATNTGTYGKVVHNYLHGLGLAPPSLLSGSRIMDL